MESGKEEAHVCVCNVI